jgi:hypothetical protein
MTPSRNEAFCSSVALLATTGNLTRISNTSPITTDMKGGTAPHAAEKTNAGANDKIQSRLVE